MGIPSYEETMLPMLKLASDKKEHSQDETVEYVSNLFKLSETERRQLLPSGLQPVIDNRVGWARTYLKKAGLLEATRMGHFRITDRGLHVLSENPSEINTKFLMQFAEFVEFRTKRTTGADKKEQAQKSLMDSVDPQEMLENAHKKIKDELASELLEKIKKSPSRFFEEVVVELLLKMGYGGSRKDAGEAIGQSGDEGIDGTINEDKLGLDTIYIQAKRWDKGVVGRPEIQKFVGALQGKKASKGIFITTSNFTNEAIDYASAVPSKVILIDGAKLTELMIEYDVGVSRIASYDVKRIDVDFFEG